MRNKSDSVGGGMRPSWQAEGSHALVELYLRGFYANDFSQGKAQIPLLKQEDGHFSIVNLEHIFQPSFGQSASRNESYWVIKVRRISLSFLS